MQSAESTHARTTDEHAPQSTRAASKPHRLAARRVHARMRLFPRGGARASPESEQAEPPLAPTIGQRRHAGRQTDRARTERRPVFCSARLPFLLAGPIPLVCANAHGLGPEVAKAILGM